MNNEMNKIIITSKTGHFGKVLGYDDRKTHLVPPPSAVLGMLETIYNREIDNFKFGYLFESDLIFKDDMTIHKKKADGKTLIKNGNRISNIHSIELHYNCKLTIYTDINEDIECDYILCMGRANNIARLHLPIKKVLLEDKQGQGFNQFTSKEIGKGRIQPINLRSEYDCNLDSYEHQIKQLRFNEIFNYDKNYDKEEKQNIFMYKVENGEVSEDND